MSSRLTCAFDILEQTLDDFCAVSSFSKEEINKFHDNLKLWKTNVTKETNPELASFLCGFADRIKQHEKDEAEIHTLSINLINLLLNAKVFASAKVSL